MSWTDWWNDITNYFSSTPSFDYDTGFGEGNIGYFGINPELDEASNITSADWDALRQAGFSVNDLESYGITDPSAIGMAGRAIRQFGKGIIDQFRKPNGDVDWGKVAILGGGILGALDRGKGGSASYQKPIPKYDVVRQQVPQTYDPNRRPGSGGQRYFTDVQYTPKTGEGAAEALTAAQTSAAEQAQGLAALNTANPLNAPPPVYQPPAPVQTTQPTPVYNPAYSGDAVLQLVRELLNASTQGRPIQQSTVSSSAPTSQTAAPAAAGEQATGLAELSQVNTASQVKARPDALTPEQREARMQEMLNMPISVIPTPIESSASNEDYASLEATKNIVSAPAPTPVAAPAPAPVVAAAPILSDDSGIASLATETSTQAETASYTPSATYDLNRLSRLAGESDLQLRNMLGYMLETGRSLGHAGIDNISADELQNYLFSTGRLQPSDIDAIKRERGMIAPPPPPPPPVIAAPPPPPGMSYDQFEGWSEYFTPEGEYRRFTSTGTPISPTRYGSDYGSIAGQYVSPYSVPASALGFTPDQPGFDARLAADELAAQQNQTTQNLARGGIVGLQDGGFVIPADVVSHLGNGSSRAGLAHLQRKGAVPIQGQGDGMSDSIRTAINNRQPAAVADGEAYLPPNRVQQMGGPERLYAMMDQVRKARTGNPKQGKRINPNQYV